jgi:quinol-cytochrome oxidoreductase complex cytochrome b subunit
MSRIGGRIPGRIPGRIAGWFEERVPISTEHIRELTNEPVPNHLKRWWFALGGTPAYLFVVQVVTGILLAVYYQPSPATAYESVRYITEEAAFGWYLRGVHKWGATLMIAAVILHQMRVYFTGAYRKPREINWMVGMTMLICTLMLGFTGYSLVYEQLSFWGATVAANLTGAVPLVGEFLRQMLLGGDTYNPRTLPRFFVLHAAALPVLLILLVGIHIALVRIQGVTELHFQEDEKDEKKQKQHFNFFPDHLYTELIMGLGLMILLSVLATVLPATLGPKANPLVTPEIIKPEWFFYVAFRWLKLFSGGFAILSTGLIVFIMFGWPFIDGWFRRRTRFQEASVWIGIVAVLAIITLTVWEGLVAH